MRLHTEITGEGVPLFLLHSGGMTGASEYEEQAEFFAKRGYQVIRPDLRGHGQSVTKEIDDYFVHAADDILDTMEALGMESVHIAGVSLGGIVALLFAKRYPKRVKSLTFSGIFPEKPEDWEVSVKKEQEYHKALFKNREAAQMLDEIHGTSDWRALLTSWNKPDWYPFDETGDVVDLAVPALCLVGGGSADEFAAAEAYKRLNRDLHISILPFAGHLVHREQPELYAHTLNTFLNSL